MKYICDSCEKYPCDDTEIKLMKYCPVYSPKPKPETNADRIRSMTDEELAFWYFNEFFLNVPYCNKSECNKDSPCEQCLLDWLKEEVSE